MPSYLFHLAFELFSDSTDQKPSREPPATFIPPPNLNLFSEDLPDHTPAAGRSLLATRNPLGRPQSDLSQERNLHQATRRTAEDQSEERTFDVAEAEGQPRQVILKAEESARASQSDADWRFGRVAVESIDMTPKPGAAISPRQQVPTGGSTLRGNYLLSDAKTTELGSGVIHLYRDGQPIPDQESRHNAKETYTGLLDEDNAYVDREGTTLCILAIPSYMTPSDLLGWLTEGTLEQISHLRLVRSERSYRYMALMKFRDAIEARDWQSRWNGKLFSSMEPENCHVIVVKSIRFQAKLPGRDSQSFPDMTNDPFTPSVNQATSAAEKSSRPSASLKSNKPAPPPTPALVELPTCPVCLERMDETNGLATIFCQHVFHCACLQKWKGSGCPVCRYTQNEQISKLKSDEHENECATCGSQANLWICLICGHVGCGRYDEAHAFAHYEQTSHSFAMDLETQHIWDYAGDEYVHRLIQNKADGKLVELPAANAHAEAGSDMVPRDKMENMSLEYTYLLTSQLDSQRLYFEEQVDRAVDKASKSAHAADRASEAVARMTERLDSLEAANNSLQDQVAGVDREKQRAERRSEKFETMSRKMEKEWREEKVVSESLLERIKHLEKQVEEATVRSSDLEEQNRDLSFFISGMEKLKNAGEDVQEGTVEIGDAPSASKKKGKKKKK